METRVPIDQCLKQMSPAGLRAAIVYLKDTGYPEDVRLAERLLAERTKVPGGPEPIASGEYRRSCRCADEAESCACPQPTPEGWEEAVRAMTSRKEVTTMQKTTVPTGWKAISLFQQLVHRAGEIAERQDQAADNLETHGTKDVRAGGWKAVLAETDRELDALTASVTALQTSCAAIPRDGDPLRVAHKRTKHTETLRNIYDLEARIEAEPSSLANPARRDELVRMKSLARFEEQQIGELERTERRGLWSDLFGQ